MRNPPLPAIALAPLADGPQASTPRGFFLKIVSAISGFRHAEIVEQTEVCAMHQAVEASALAISSIACMNSIGETSSPPSERGTSIRYMRAWCSASTRSAGSSRSASIRGAAAAMTGARSRALATQSTFARSSISVRLAFGPQMWAAALFLTPCANPVHRFAAAAAGLNVRRSGGD